MTITTDRPTALYRAFAADGALLYVGIAFDPEARWRTHRWDKPWWPEVARTTAEWHPDEITARKAEGAAVRDERPAYNRTLPAADGSHSFRPIAPRVPCARSRTSAGRFRMDDREWERFRAAVERSPDPEADMSKVMRQFVRWYCREPHAKLPDRAPAAPEATS